MSKIKSFLSKPFTWGGYFKLVGACWLASIAFMAGWYAWLTHGITWGKGSKEEEEEEEPAYSWTDED